MKSAREIAVRGLIEVFDHEGYSNLVLDQGMKKAELPPQERAFCAALFYGVVERCITLDWVLGRYSRQPVEKLTPAVRAILRLALYQLLYMPSVPDRAAVDEAVKLTRVLRVASAGGFVNGVLRHFLRDEKAVKLPRDPQKALAVQYSVPEALIALWQDAYGEEKTLSILEGCGGPPPLFARVNTTRTTAEALISRLSAEGVIAERTDLPDALRLINTGDITALPSFTEGLFHIQDLSSQRCAAALGARPGDRVLDVCSAPGGKSFTATEGMDGKGTLLAMDLSQSRLGLVAEGAARLGLSCIETRANDATQYHAELGQFDRILCDVVCSGYGVIRRKPEIRYKLPETVALLPETQYQILTTSACYLTEGGRLVYSTCTLNPAENEQVVERFLAGHPAFSLVDKTVTCFPAPQGGDGFFYAVLQRRSH